VSATATLKAIAYASGYTNSGVTTAAYTITPVAAPPAFSPAAGTYTTAQTVTIGTTSAMASGICAQEGKVDSANNQAIAAGMSGRTP